MIFINFDIKEKGKKEKLCQNTIIFITVFSQYLSLDLTNRKRELHQFPNSINTMKFLKQRKKLILPMTETN